MLCVYGFSLNSRLPYFLVWSTASKGALSSLCTGKDIFILSRIRGFTIHVGSEWCQASEKWCKSIFHGILRTIWHPCTPSFLKKRRKKNKGMGPSMWTSWGLTTMDAQSNGREGRRRASMASGSLRTQWRGKIKVSDRARKKITLQQLHFVGVSPSFICLSPNYFHPSSKGFILISSALIFNRYKSLFETF